jgi:hypothetical protein
MEPEEAEPLPESESESEACAEGRVCSCRRSAKGLRTPGREYSRRLASCSGDVVGSEAVATNATLLRGLASGRGRRIRR